MKTPHRKYFVVQRFSKFSDEPFSVPSRLRTKVGTKLTDKIWYRPPWYDPVSLWRREWEVYDCVSTIKKRNQISFRNHFFSFPHVSNKFNLSLNLRIWSHWWTEEATNENFYEVIENYLRKLCEERRCSEVNVNVSLKWSWSYLCTRYCDSWWCQ